MDDINIEDYFDVVIEPGHSKSILLGLQKKYGYDSVKLYRLHKRDYKYYEKLDIKEDDYRSWIHHFIIFTQTGGGISDLSEVD